VSRGGPLSERVLVLAPRGRDGPLAVAILREIGVTALTCTDLVSLIECLGEGAGSALIADEAITDADLRQLVAFLKNQPPWSDIPIILLTQRGGGPERNPAAARIAEILGNVTFLERPFHPTTLASVVRTAGRSRRRQYEARARMEELTEAEQRLQTALKGGQLGAWTLDIDSQELHASETYRAHFGRGPDQPFTYADLLASVHPDDVERRQATLDASIESGRDYRIEYRIIWPDGSTHWIDIRARGVRDHGRIRQLVGVAADITERKTLEHDRESLLIALASERAALAELSRTLEQRVRERSAELTTAVAAREKAQEQLLQSQKMEAIGQLTGGVAHDFNNLLLAVIGNLELLRKHLPDEPPLRALLDGAMQGAERGATLTQRMLAFARQQDLKTTPTDLAQLVGGMRHLLERALGPGISLTVSAAENLPPGQVDANQVELAILNLAINARDAMPNGGAIRIEIEQHDGAAIDGLKHEPYLRLSVCDTGTGMDAATLSKAIEPFFSTKALGKGTGLGLSMVHGLAVQLGGRLDLASAPGKGTTATLWLPVATTLPVRIETSASEAQSTRLARILLVDDDTLIRTSTVALLEDLGHTVVDADSARHALEILAVDAAFDIVMTDQAMPEMTGVELARIIEGKYPHMPILLATGFTDLPPGQRIDLPRLTKPYRLAQLQAAIGQLLRPPRGDRRRA